MTRPYAADHAPRVLSLFTYSLTDYFVNPRSIIQEGCSVITLPTRCEGEWVKWSTYLVYCCGDVEERI